FAALDPFLDLAGGERADQAAAGLALLKCGHFAAHNDLDEPPQRDGPRAGDLRRKGHREITKQPFLAAPALSPHPRHRESSSSSPDHFAAVCACSSNTNKEPAGLKMDLQNAARGLR